MLTPTDGQNVVAEVRLAGDYGGTAFTVTDQGGTSLVGVRLAPLPVQHDFTRRWRRDFLIENTAGAVVVGEVRAGQAGYAEVAGLGPEWTFVGTGDFLGDGKASFLIENTTGAVVVGEVVRRPGAATRQVGGPGPGVEVRRNRRLPGRRQDRLPDREHRRARWWSARWSSGQAAYTQVAALGPEWKFVGTRRFPRRRQDRVPDREHRRRGGGRRGRRAARRPTPRSPRWARNGSSWAPATSWATARATS